MGSPDEQKDAFEPGIFLFEQNSAGDLRWTNFHRGIVTLAEVMEHVLNLKRQEFECPSGLLMTYMPGDWVLSWAPSQPHKLSDVEIAAFENILNDEFDLGVKVGWKSAERPDGIHA